MALLVALAPLTAPAAERDILDAAAERPLGITINGQPNRFGDPKLDSAESALRNYLPRPWTATRIHALFQAAYTRLGEAQKQANVSPQDRVFDESMALVEHLGVLLAASRDPRAALALGQVLETSEKGVITCTLSNTFLDYFGRDTSYQRPSAEAPVISVSNGCVTGPQDVHKWWLLNQREVERQAAAVTAGLPPCTTCKKEALAAIDKLRIRLHDSAPTLHVTIQGAGIPRIVHMELTISPVSGQSGGSRMSTNDTYTSPDIRLRIPGRLLGRGDMRLSGIVTSSGYHSVTIELERINDARVVPVVLVPIW